jgi:hypothetical protein
MGYEAGQKMIETLTASINESMPKIVDWYLELLAQRFAEANGDVEQIKLAWEGFRTALVDVPNLVESELRKRHLALFAMLKDAGTDHLIAGIIRQEAAKYTDKLPDDIRREWMQSDTEGLRRGES